MERSDAGGYRLHFPRSIDRTSLIVGRDAGKSALRIGVVESTTPRKLSWYADVL